MPDFQNRSTFYEFALMEESEDDLPRLPDFEKTLLEKFYRYVNNGIRPIDSLLLLELIENGKISKSELVSKYQKRFGLPLSAELIESSFNFVNFKFNTEPKSGKRVPVGDIYRYEIIFEINLKKCYL